MKDLATHPLRKHSQSCLARKKIKTKWVGKAEQRSMYFFLKEFTKCSLEFLPRYYKRDILRHIKKDIFNPSFRYPKYLKISLANYKEKIGNYTKYLEIKI